jgi:hypothetical protein
MVQGSVMGLVFLPPELHALKTSIFFGNKDWNFSCCLLIYWKDLENGKNWQETYHSQMADAYWKMLKTWKNKRLVINIKCKGKQEHLIQTPICKSTIGFQKGNHSWEISSIAIASIWAHNQDFHRKAEVLCIFKENLFCLFSKRNRLEKLTNSTRLQPCGNRKW